MPREGQVTEEQPKLCRLHVCFPLPLFLVGITASLEKGLRSSSAAWKGLYNGASRENGFSLLQGDQRVKQNSWLPVGI